MPPPKPAPKAAATPPATKTPPQEPAAKPPHQPATPATPQDPPQPAVPEKLKYDYPGLELVPGLSVLSAYEREKLRLMPTVEDYIALVFHLGETKHEIRKLFTRFPFKVNREAAQKEKEKMQMGQESGEVQEQKPATMIPISLGSPLIKKKDQTDVGNTTYPEYDPASYDKLNDLEIFKKSIEWVGEYLDIKAFERFNIKEKIKTIDFSSVASKFE